MCGRFTQTKSKAEVLEHLAEIELPPLFHRRYNIAPTQRITVIRQQNPHTAEEYIWGFKNPRSTSPIINARSETLAERPMFKNLLYTHRCLIPADGFYEWKGKQPYYFQTLGKQLFAFAGLWQNGRCVIITRAADQNMKGIHHRMPIILAPSQWNDWLLVTKTGKINFQLPEMSESLTVGPVSRHVNKVRNDNPECIHPSDEQIDLSLFPDEE